MEVRDAYEAICDAITADGRKRIVSRRFEEQHFGSFAVSFYNGSEARCVLNDRGFVAVTKSLNGTGEAT